MSVSLLIRVALTIAAVLSYMIPRNKAAVSPLTLRDGASGLSGQLTLQFQVIVDSKTSWAL